MTGTVLATDRAPSVVAHHLTKRYGAHEVVSDLSFEVAAGRVTGFLGPNGAGKTTTMRMMLDLTEPTRGRATILGHRYRDLRDPLRRVGVLLDSAGFHPGRTARNHLRLLTLAAGMPAGRVDQLLDQVELGAAADRAVGGFSTGMKRRLGLAAALVGDPQILLLDEPANGLDPAGTLWLRRLLRSLAAQGRTVFVSSHVLGEMEQTVDHLVILRAGRLVADAPLADVLARRQMIQVRTPEPARLAEALTRAGGEATPSGTDGLVVTGLSAAAVGDVAFDRGVRLHLLSDDTSSLEDAFLALTAQERS